MIHVGVLIGSIMAFNVFAVIIPNQKKIVAALMAGQEPDPELGAASKLRSVHNNYLTLPVVALMISNHYPQLTASSGYSWLVVACILIVLGAAVRHFLQPPRRRRPARPRSAGRCSVAAVESLIGAIWLTLPQTTVATVGRHRERRRGAGDHRQALRHVPLRSIPPT